MLISNAKVAIVIPSAAGEKILSRCLNTIIRHTIVNYRLCIVSQGEFGAADYLRHKQMQLDTLFVHYSEKNEPGSRGYNKGIALAHANVPDFRYLLLLDDDIVVLSQGWLNTLCVHLDTNPKCGIVGYRMCCAGGVAKAGRVLEFMSCCMLIRRETIRKIGPMDSRLLWHCNDSDYCWRAWQAGYTVEVLDAEDNGDKSNKFLYHSHQMGTRNLKNEEKLRKKTYKVFDEKWKGAEIAINTIAND